MHNFRHLVRENTAAPWAADVEGRFIDQVRSRDWRSGPARGGGPGEKLAAPTPEFLAPAFVSLGPSTEQDAEACQLFRRSAR